MEEPDPTRVADLAELAALLKRLHLKAGRPSLRDLESRTKHDKQLLPGTRLEKVRLGRTTISKMLGGQKLPTKQQLLTFVDVCGIDLAADRRWEQVWDRLALADDRPRGHSLRASTGSAPAGEATATSADDTVPAELPTAEVFARMLASARDLVFNEGVLITVGDDVFDQAIERARVSRASANRLWPTKNEFARDLLLYLTDPTVHRTAAYDQLTIDKVRDIVLRNSDKLGDPLERRRLLLEAIRSGVEQSLNAVTDSKEWYIYMALNAAARSAGDDLERLRMAAALLDGQKRLINQFAALYDQMLAVLRMRFRSDAYTTRHMAVIGAALVEGLALRKFLHLAIDQAAEKPAIEATDWALGNLIGGSLPGPSPGGAITDDGWSLAALAFLGIVDALVEPIPSEDPGPEREAASGT